jgi:hypothetical protein
MQMSFQKSINRKDIVKIRYLAEEFNEKSLWKAVICQAFEDATSGSIQRKRLNTKRVAIKWLIEDNEDFKMVCHLAGYNPNIVKRNFKELLKPNYNASFGKMPIELIKIKTENLI